MGLFSKSPRKDSSTAQSLSPPQEDPSFSSHQSNHTQSFDTTPQPQDTDPIHYPQRESLLSKLRRKSDIKFSGLPTFAGSSSASSASASTLATTPTTLNPSAARRPSHTPSHQPPTNSPYTHHISSDNTSLHSSSSTLNEDSTTRHVPVVVTSRDKPGKTRVLIDPAIEAQFQRYRDARTSVVPDGRGGTVTQYHGRGGVGARAWAMCDASGGYGVNSSVGGI